MILCDFPPSNVWFCEDLRFTHSGALEKLAEHIQSGRQTGQLPLRIVILLLKGEHLVKFGIAEVNLWVMIEDACKIIRQV